MKKVFLFLISLSPLFVNAQEELTLRFLSQLQQSSWTTPSNMTDAKISAGLPGVSSTNVNFFCNGLTYNKLFKKEDTITYLQLGDVIANLKSKNFVGFNSSVALLNFNYTGKKFALGFFINERLTMQLAYPGDLLKLLWNGNGNTLGKDLQVGDFALNVMHYQELALHFSTKIKKNWTFGINPKMLLGKSDIYTRESRVTVAFSPDYYALSASGNLDLRTSGIPDNAEISDPAFYQSNLFNTKNHGFAVDLSVRYEVKKFSFCAGINDLGFIKWSSHVRNYTANLPTVYFDGIHAENIFRNDTSLDYSLNGYADSLKNKVQFEKNENAYTTGLPFNLYAMSTYSLGKHHTFGAQFNLYSYEKNINPALMLFYQLKLGKCFSLAGTYSWKKSSDFNLGGALILKLSKAQCYLVTDNWWAAVRPKDASNVNVRLGINFVLGDADKKNEKLNETDD